MSKGEKEFDSIAMMRSMRDRISEQLEGMTREERLNWLASQEPRDPLLKRLLHRPARRAYSANCSSNKR